MDQFAENAILIPLAFIRFFVIIEVSTEGDSREGWTSMIQNAVKSPYAAVKPIHPLQNRWTGGLWKERFDTCKTVTIPHIRQLFEDENGFHVVENFRIAAGQKEGHFKGTPFGDGDFYKWMEGAILTAVLSEDADMLAQIDAYIALIAKAQLEDGYISTKQIIGERQGNGVVRQGDINDFEVYNIGHLLTAACLHDKTTGKTNFMGCGPEGGSVSETSV